MGCGASKRVVGEEEVEEPGVQHQQRAAPKTAESGHGQVQAAQLMNNFLSHLIYPCAAPCMSC